MSTLSILRELPSLFRYADVEKYTGNANVFLTRALKKGFVERIVRGVYLNTMRDVRPSIEEVACFLRTPSYISCEWALNSHGILMQAPLVCTVVTLETSVGRSRDVSFGGVKIEFSRIAARIFCGFESHDGFNLASPEKALLDTVYLRRRVPFPDELDLDALNRDELMRLAEMYPAVVKKRLGRACPQSGG